MNKRCNTASSTYLKILNIQIQICTTKTQVAYDCIYNLVKPADNVSIYQNILKSPIIKKLKHTLELQTEMKSIPTPHS